MTRVSLRYFYALTACLLVALIPVVVHSYLHLETDDCKGVQRFIPSNTPTSISEKKRDAWMRDTFHSTQWYEGSFAKDDLRFDFSIIRSYDAKRLYHRPENYFAERAFVQRRGVEWLPTSSGEVPIHRTYYGSTQPATVLAYLLVYHSSPVANPYLAQLRAAPAELFGGQHPMTLFLIQAHGPADHFDRMETIAREWLLSARATYGSACAD
jgi:hypothetical protein